MMNVKIHTLSWLIECYCPSAVEKFFVDESRMDILVRIIIARKNVLAASFK